MTSGSYINACDFSSENHFWFIVRSSHPTGDLVKAKSIARAAAGIATALVLSLTAACSSNDSPSDEGTLVPTTMPDTNNAALGIIKAMQESGVQDIQGPFSRTSHAHALPSGTKSYFAADTSQVAASWTSTAVTRPGVVEKQSNTAEARAAVFTIQGDQARAGKVTEYTYFNGPWVLRLPSQLPYDLAQTYVEQFKGATGTFDDSLPTVKASQTTCNILYTLHSVKLDDAGALKVNKTLANAITKHLLDDPNKKFDTLDRDLTELRALAVAIQASNHNSKFTDAPQQEFVARFPDLMFNACAYWLGNSMSFGVKTTTQAG